VLIILFAAEVTETCYRRVFTSHFNMDFMLPRTDTCKTCDNYEIKCEASTSAEETDLDKQEWEMHKKKVNDAFQLLKAETEKAKSNPMDQATICFDLQQALPTPKLSCGPAFYKGK